MELHQILAKTVLMDYSTALMVGLLQVRQEIAHAQRVILGTLGRVVRTQMHVSPLQTLQKMDLTASSTALMGER